MKKDRENLKNIELKIVYTINSMKNKTPSEQYGLLAKIHKLLIAHWQNPASSGKDTLCLQMSSVTHQIYLSLAQNPQPGVEAELKQSKLKNKELVDLCCQMLDERPGGLDDKEKQRYKLEFEESGTGGIAEQKVDISNHGKTFLTFKPGILKLFETAEKVCHLPESETIEKKVEALISFEMVMKKKITTSRAILKVITADNFKFSHMNTIITNFEFLVGKLCFGKFNEETFKLKQEILDLLQGLVDSFNSYHDLFLLQRQIYYYRVFKYFIHKKIEDPLLYNFLEKILTEEVKNPALLQGELELSVTAFSLCKSNFNCAGLYQSHVLSYAKNFSKKIINDFGAWWSAYSSRTQPLEKSRLYCRIFDHILMGIGFFIDQSESGYVEKLVKSIEDNIVLMQNFSPLVSDCVPLIIKIDQFIKTRSQQLSETRHSHVRLFLVTQIERWKAIPNVLIALILMEKAQQTEKNATAEKKIEIPSSPETQALTLLSILRVEQKTDSNSEPVKGSGKKVKKKKKNSLALKSMIQDDSAPKSPKELVQTVGLTPEKNQPLKEPEPQVQQKEAVSQSPEEKPVTDESSLNIVVEKRAKELAKKTIKQQERIFNKKAQKLRDSRDKLVTDLKALKKKRDLLTEEAKITETQFAEQGGELKATKNHHELLKQKNSDLVKELELARKQLAERDKEKQALIAEHALALTEQEEGLTRQIQSLQAKCGSMRLESETLRSELDQSKKESTRLREQVTARDTTLTLAQSKLSESNEKLKQEYSQTDDLRRNLNDNQQRLLTAQRELAIVKAEREADRVAAQKSVAACCQEIKLLRGQLIKSPAVVTPVVAVAVPLSPRPWGAFPFTAPVQLIEIPVALAMMPSYSGSD